MLITTIEYGLSPYKGKFEPQGGPQSRTNFHFQVIWEISVRNALFDPLSLIMIGKLLFSQEYYLSSPRSWSDENLAQDDRGLHASWPRASHFLPWHFAGMELLSLVFLLTAALIVVVLVIVAIVEVTSRVEIHHAPDSNMKEILPRLKLLNEQYRRPRWLSWSSFVHSFATLVKPAPDLPYRR